LTASDTEVQDRDGLVNAGRIQTMKPRSQTTKIEEVRARLSAVYAAMPVFDAPFEEFYRKLRYQTRELDAEHEERRCADVAILGKEISTIAKHIHDLAERRNVRDATMIRIGNRLSQIADAISRHP
jgi:mRNA-degrading endonuclease toxin of MazEF toxin-antitoxin module